MKSGIKFIAAALALNLGLSGCAGPTVGQELDGDFSPMTRPLWPG